MPMPMPLAMGMGLIVALATATALPFYGPHRGHVLYLGFNLGIGHGLANIYICIGFKLVSAARLVKHILL